MAPLKEKIQMERWKVYTSIFFMICTTFGFLINTIYSAVSLESRMFDTKEQKEIVLRQAEWSLEHKLEVNKLQGEYVKKEDYREDINEIKATLKEINQYLRRR